MSTWNPESGSPLTASAINMTAVEETSMKLWAEFLYGYFDGNLHMLRGAYVPLPTVNKIHFQEDSITVREDAMDGLYIGITQERPAKAVKRLFPGEVWRITERVKLSFWFRARVKTPQGGQNGHSLVRWGSDTLFAILTSNLLSAPLSRKGMSSFCPQPPTLLSGGAISMRQLSLTVTYNYSEQEASLTTVPLLEGDVPGNIVYIGSSKNVRVTPYGLERLGPDGNWYEVDINLWTDQGGDVPTLDVGKSPIPGVVGIPVEPVAPTVIMLGDDFRLKAGKLQSLNPSSGLWHGVTTEGTPPAFTLSESGEA